MNIRKTISSIILGGVLAATSVISSFAYTQEDLQTVVDTAYNELGKPYVFGSAPYDNSSHDCSSLMMYCYSKIGIELPRVSVNQAEVGLEVPIDEIREGDIVCMHTSDRNGVGKTSHVGLYIGNGKLIEARGRRYGGVITNLEDRKPIITTVRRILVESEVAK